MSRHHISRPRDIRIFLEMWVDTLKWTTDEGRVQMLGHIFS